MEDIVLKYLEYFFTEHVNLTFFILFSLIAYGIEYSDEFDWFEQLFEGTARPYRLWVAGLILIVIQCFFKYHEINSFDYNYLAILLQTQLIVIVFNKTTAFAILKLKSYFRNKLSTKESKNRK
jgi:hypothetical protein